MEKIVSRPSEKIQLSSDLVITLLGAESLGVRSLAIHVQTGDTSLLIDPGVALGFRDGYHPHPIEYQLLAKIRNKIIQFAERTNVIVISHYHHDHFMPFFQNYAYFWSTSEDAKSLYANRQLWCKDIRHHINYSQQSRGYNFIRSARKIAKEITYADGRSLTLGQTIVRFSPAVSHGEVGTKLGWVIMTSIRCNDFSIVHASDIQGPMIENTANWIIRQKPDLLILGGPPTYLSPDRVSPLLLEQAATNLKSLATKIPMVIIDHHLLRDRNYSEWLDPIQQAALDKGHQLMTVSGVLGQPANLLEATRETLYNNFPINPAFASWIKQIRQSRTTTPPPLSE